MAKNLLLIDDEAPKVIELNMEPFTKDQNYEISSQITLDNISWELVDRADVILLDYYFQNQRTGIEFLKMLKKERPDFSAPLILLSKANELQQADWQECVSLGVQDFESKSTPPQVLKLKIDKIIKAEDYRRQADSLKEQLQIKEKEAGIDSLNLSYLQALVKDQKDWNYILRVILEGGPLHHQETHKVFLEIFDSLFSLLADKMKSDVRPYPYKTITGPIEKPEHPQPGHHRPMLDRHLPDRYAFKSTVPLGIPSRMLSEVLEKDEPAILEITRNLLMGPPHEVFMNVLLFHICEAIYQMIGGD